MTQLTQGRSHMTGLAIRDFWRYRPLLPNTSPRDQGTLDSIPTPKISLFHFPVVHRPLDLVFWARIMPLISTLTPRLSADPPGLPHPDRTPQTVPSPFGPGASGGGSPSPPAASVRAPPHNCVRSPFSNGGGWGGVANRRGERCPCGGAHFS